jgi:hypothetical protein
MTFLSPVGGAMSPPPAILSRQVLDMQVRVRRARLPASATATSWHQQPTDRAIPLL